MSCGQKCRIAENVVFIQVREQRYTYVLRTVSLGHFKYQQSTMGLGKNRVT